MNDKLKFIADHYGKMNQLRQTEKELIELADVLNHFADGKAVDVELIDELADVIIMIKQLIYLYDIEKPVSDRAAYKLNRQISRIKAEVEEE